MIGADRGARHGGSAFRTQEDGRVGAILVEQGDVLRKRDRNSAQRCNCLADLAACFEDVANDQDDREAEALCRASAEGDARNKPVGIHAVEAPAPWALAL